ncbi:hypothetical protein ABZX30_02855 [Streptomyces sp. NPDC004542]|uniref:hypothetical protein n=1 Tax=Streptomyces sp. NPDC004542 TaxID=3154281 RepID=UPI0033AD2B00
MARHQPTLSGAEFEEAEVTGRGVDAYGAELAEDRGGLLDGAGGRGVGHHAGAVLEQHP